MVLTDEWRDGKLVCGQIDDTEFTKGWMEGWMAGFIDGWMNKLTGESE